MSKIVLVAAHCCHLHNKCLRSSPSSANLCLALWKVNFEENVYFDYVCVCVMRACKECELIIGKYVFMVWARLGRVKVFVCLVMVTSSFGS